MANYSNFKHKTRTDIINKYGINLKEFEAIRKRTGERIKNAKKLYNWKDYDVPSINQLVEYQVRKKQGILRNNIGQFDVILDTPATKKISRKAKIHAIDVYSGNSTYNRGFNTFASGIPQFTIMRENAKKLLAVNVDFASLELLKPFNVGEKISTDKGYYFRKNDEGKRAVRDINMIFSMYNNYIDTQKRSEQVLGDPNSRYIHYIRRIMEIISIADDHDAMGGSD